MCFQNIHEPIILNKHGRLKTIAPIKLFWGAWYIRCVENEVFVGWSIGIQMT